MFWGIGSASGTEFVGHVVFMVLAVGDACQCLIIMMNDLLSRRVENMKRIVNVV
jgi:hypothetical protein